MNKPSDIADFLDRAFDIRDYMIDAQNQSIQNEIKWLNDNYDNIEALRAHFTKMYGVVNLPSRDQILNQLNDYSMERLHVMAKYRANFLYKQYYANEKRKGDHFALKPISEILKLMGA